MTTSAINLPNVHIPTDLSKTLDADEQLLWHCRISQPYKRAGGIILSAVACAVLAAIVAYILICVSGEKYDIERLGYSTVFYILLALGGIIAVSLAIKEPVGKIYAVTNRRAIILSQLPNGKLKCVSISPQALGSVRAEPKTADGGNIYFDGDAGTEQNLYAQQSQPPAKISKAAFVGLPQLQPALDAINALKKPGKRPAEQRSNHIDAPEVQNAPEIIYQHLDAGEKLLWLQKPQAWKFAIAAWHPGYLLLLALMVFNLYIDISVSGVKFALLGLAIISIAGVIKQNTEIFFAYKKAKNTFYAITNRRLLIITRSLKGSDELTSFLPHQLTELDVILPPSGANSITIHSPALKGLAFTAASLHTGIFCTPYIHKAAALLQTLSCDTKK